MPFRFFKLLFIVLLIPWSALAYELVTSLELDDSNVNTYNLVYVDLEKLPQFRWTEERALEIVFSSKKVATFFMKQYILKNQKISGQLIETTCFPEHRNIPCETTVDVGVEEYSLVWSKHPDPEMIGKMVKMKTDNVLGDGRELVDKQEFWFFERNYEKFPVHNLIGTDLKNSISAPRLTCDNGELWNDLTSDFSKSSNLDLNINEVSSERMTRNPEINIDENRTENSIFGVLWKKDTENTFVLDDIAFVPNVKDRVTLLFFGDVVGWNLNNGKNVCDLSFKYNTEKFVRNLLEPELTTKPHRQGAIKSLEPIDLKYLGSENFGGFNFPKEIETSHLKRLEYAIDLKIVEFTHSQETMKFKYTNSNGEVEEKEKSVYVLRYKQVTQ